MTSPIPSPGLIDRISHLRLTSQQIAEGVYSGLHRSPRQGRSVEFAEHRPYSIGDEIRRIDWRVVARTDRVVVKRYEEETSLTIQLVLDASRSMAFSSGAESKFAYGQRLIAALAYLGIHQQDAVGLTLFSETVSDYCRPSRQFQQLDTIIERLLSLEPQGATDFERLEQLFQLNRSPRSLLILISDLLLEINRLEPVLRTLAQRHSDLLVLQLFDPAERLFPYSGIIRFRSMEDSRSIVMSADGLRSGYLERINQHLQAIGDVCGKVGISYQWVDSSMPPEVSLTRLLGGRIG